MLILSFLDDRFIKRSSPHYLPYLASKYIKSRTSEIETWRITRINHQNCLNNLARPPIVREMLSWASLQPFIGQTAHNSPQIPAHTVQAVKSIKMFLFFRALCIFWSAFCIGICERDVLRAALASRICINRSKLLAVSRPVWNLLTCRNISEIHSVSLSHKGSANGPDSLTFSYS